VSGGPGGAPAADTGPEQVIGVIERPSLLRLAASPAASPQNLPQQTSTAVIAPPPHPARVPSVATSAGVLRRPDINQELVERIEELYRRVQQQTPNRHSAPAAAV